MNPLSGVTDVSDATIAGMEINLSGDFLWRFMAAAMLVHGVMMALAKATRAIAPSIWERRWFKAFVAFQNLTWGAIVGLPPFLPGKAIGDRVMIGMVAGLLSHLAYEAITKRFQAVQIATKPAPATPPPER